MEQSAKHGSPVYTGGTMEEGGNQGNFALINPINPPPMTSKSEGEDEACLKSLPPGMRFRPLDVELLVWYLKRKVYKKALPPNRIKDVELYNYDPQTLTEMSNNKSFNGTMNEWYFFTPRDRKYPKGSRPSRRAGNGFWKATGADKHVKHNGSLIGLKKTLVFFQGKQPHGEKTNWIMHEYVLSNPPARERESNDDMRLDDWVLCRLYQNQKDAKSKPDETPERGTNQKQEETEAAIPGQIPPSQSDQQFQLEDFNARPLQTYPMPSYNNAIHNSTIPACTSARCTDMQIPPPQSDHQFRVEDFNTWPLQTYTTPFYNIALDNSTSRGLPALPESFHRILEPVSTIFPLQAAVPDYGNFIPSFGPMSSVPPDDIHQHHQQHFSNLSNNCFQDANQFLSDPDWGFDNHNCRDSKQ